MPLRSICIRGARGFFLLRPGRFLRFSLRSAKCSMSRSTVGKPELPAERQEVSVRSRCERTKGRAGREVWQLDAPVETGQLGVAVLFV